MRLHKVLRVLSLGVAMIASHVAIAQQPRVPVVAANAPATQVPPPSSAPLPPRPTPIAIDAGTGQLVQLPGPATTILAADPRIARVQPASPTTIFVMGVAPGRTTIIATAEAGTPIAEYEVTIRPGAGALATTGGPEPARSVAPTPRALESGIRRAVPSASQVRVAAGGKNAFVLSGTVANPAESQRIEAVARSIAAEGHDVINNLEVLSSTQVNVRVRVAEISRQITRELGFNWQVLGKAGSFLLGFRTGGDAGTVANAVTSAAVGTGSLASTATRFAAGVSTSTLDINSVIDALAADQLITILAEPNLTAQSGETASFLAGGEFPVPTGTGGSSTSITVDFKQYGVSLAFVPTVLGPNRLNLRIRPEVSELSNNGSVSIPLSSGSVTIPALTVRRAETTVELGSGQSFAIAGLLQRNTTQTDSGVLGLGDLPIIGPLFRSNQFQRNETELVIIVTPYLVKPVSDPNALVAPTDRFQPATDLERIINQRQIARGAPAPQLRSRPDAGFIVE